MEWLTILAISFMYQCFSSYHSFCQLNNTWKVVNIIIYKIEFSQSPHFMKSLDHYASKDLRISMKKLIVMSIIFRSRLVTFIRFLQFIHPENRIQKTFFEMLIFFYIIVSIREVPLRTFIMYTLILKLLNLLWIKNFTSRQVKHSDHSWVPTLRSSPR